MCSDLKMYQQKQSEEFKEWIEGSFCGFILDGDYIHIGEVEKLIGIGRITDDKYYVSSVNGSGILEYI